MSEIEEKFYEDIIQSEDDYKTALFLKDMMNNNIRRGRYYYFKKQLKNELSNYNFFDEFNASDGESCIRFSNAKSIHIGIYIYQDNIRLFLEFNNKNENKVRELLKDINEECYYNSDKIIEKERENFIWNRMCIFNLTTDESKIKCVFEQVLHYSKNIDKYFYDNKEKL